MPTDCVSMFHAKPDTNSKTGSELRLVTKLTCYSRKMYSMAKVKTQVSQFPQLPVYRLCSYTTGNISVDNVQVDITQTTQRHRFPVKRDD